jgi:general secretion pathway protein G
VRSLNRFSVTALIGVAAFFVVSRATQGEEQAKPELERRVARLEEEVSKLEKRINTIELARGSNRRTMAAAKADVAALDVMLDMFEVDVGRYPTTGEGIEALVKQPASVKGWHGPYVKRMPTDPWGHPYVYRYPGEHNKKGFDLLSSGPDGQIGTDDDVTNWSDK